MKSASRPTVVVIGSANMDLLSRVKTFPRPGETRSGDALQQRPGGKGVNQAIAAARCGAKVSFIGNIGHGAFGDVLVQGLEREGIDLTHLARSSRLPAGTALILLNEAGENQIVVTRSSNDLVSPAQIRRAKKLIQGADMVLLQMEIPWASVQAAIEIAHAAGVPVILTPAPVTQPLPKGVLSKITWLTPNEHELAILTGQRVDSPAEIEAAAGWLLAQGVPNVVVTCGARGAFWASKTTRKWAPAPVVKVIDTVGAGDFFNGAFAFNLAAGRGALGALDASIRIASAKVAQKS
jgi:ribokinase